MYVHMTSFPINLRFHFDFQKQKVENVFIYIRGLKIPLSNLKQFYNICKILRFNLLRFNFQVALIISSAIQFSLSKLTGFSLPTYINLRQ